MVRVAQVDVLTAGARCGGAEFGVGERADERDCAAGRPGAEDERRAVEAPGDDIGIDEDARTDDAADHDHRRVERAQGALEGHG